MRKDETLGAVVLFVFGGAVTILSLRMDIGTFRMAGTGMFPLFLGILLMVLSAAHIFKISLQAKKEQAKKGGSVESSGPPLQTILFLAAMVLATLFVNRLGYPLTAFFLMVALLRVLGIKRWGRNILISAATAAGSYVLFAKWLDIPMPKGFIGL